MESPGHGRFQDQPGLAVFSFAGIFGFLHVREYLVEVR